MVVAIMVVTVAMMLIVMVVVVVIMVVTMVCTQHHSPSLTFTLTHTITHAQHHSPSHSPSTCSSIETISPRLLQSANPIASSPSWIVAIDEMASAWLVLQQHALDISTLDPAHSTPKGAQPLQTYHHSTGDTNTHYICMVGVYFGFDQRDDTVGMPIISSRHQRRPIILRTHNDKLRDNSSLQAFLI